MNLLQTAKELLAAYKKGMLGPYDIGEICQICTALLEAEEVIKDYVSFIDLEYGEKTHPDHIARAWLAKHCGEGE